MPVTRSKFFASPWQEVLRHDEGANFSRLNKGAPILLNHDAQAVPLGVVERAWVEDGRGIADIRFSRRNKVKEVLNDIRDGVLSNVSVGYTVEKRTLVEKGSKGNPPVYEVDWTPREISVVSVPEDSSVGFGRSADYEVIPLDSGSSATERQDMSTEKEDVRVDESAPSDVDIVAERRSWQREEQSRLDALAEMFKPYMDGYRGLYDECRGDMNVTAQEASRRLLNEIATNPHAPLGGPRIESGETDQEKLLRGAEEALCVRGFLVDEPQKVDLSNNEFRGMELTEIAKICLQRSGGDYTGSKMELVKRAITHSTSDFPQLMSNVANKGLMRGFNENTETYQAWTRPESVSDFKTVTRVGLGGVSTLDEISENEQYENGTFSEYAETGQLTTYGKILNLSRRMIVNDDLSGLTRLPNLMGRRAAEKVGDLAYSVLTTNANLSDGVALFATGRGNLVTSGAVPSTATVEAGRSALATFTARTGETITIVPRYMLCAHGLLGTARATLESESWVGTPGSAEASDQANIVRGLVTPIADRRLDAYASGAPWFLVPDPSRDDFVILLYLDGRQTPILEREEGFDVDGLRYKIRFDVAAMVLAPHAYQNDGVT